MIQQTFPSLLIGEQEYQFVLYGGGSRWRPCIVLRADTYVDDVIITVQFIRCGRIYSVLLEFIIPFTVELLDTEVL